MSVRYCGQLIDGVSVGKRGLCLAILALANGELIANASIAKYIYGESSTYAIENTKKLRQSLRRQLNTWMHRDAIIGDRRYTRLDCSDVSVDVTEFTNALSNGDLNRAVGFYSGLFLDGKIEENNLDAGWGEIASTFGTAHSYSYAYVKARRSLAARAIKEADYDCARDHILKALVELQTESLYCSLMRIELLRNSPDEVLSAYQSLIRSNTKLVPSSQARRLRRRALDLVRHQRGEPLPDAFVMPLITASPLPIPRKLIGRDSDIATVNDVLRQHRLVTLVGYGGVGKTELALHIGNKLRHLYRDGVVFIDLTASTDRRVFRNRILQALGIADQTDYFLEVVGNALANGRWLLIVDNCEHCLEDVRTFIASVLRRSEFVDILATSQRALSMTDECLFEVNPLDMPSGPHLSAITVHDLENYPAIKLFAARASERDRHFKLTIDNAQAVANICWMTGGIPLYLEMSASWTDTQDVISIAEALLSNKRDILTFPDDLYSSNPLGSERPNYKLSMASLLDYGHAQLSTADARCINRLSLFRVAFDVDAAHELLVGSVRRQETVQTLRRLKLSSWLHADRTSNSPGKFVILPVVRSYCLQLLSDSGDYSSAEADFINLVEGQIVKLPDPGEIPTAGQIRDFDEDNTLFGIEAAALRGDMRVWRWLAVLSPYMFYTGYWEWPYVGGIKTLQELTDLSHIDAQYIAPVIHWAIILTWLRALTPHQLTKPIEPSIAAHIRGDLEARTKHLLNGRTLRERIDEAIANGSPDQLAQFCTIAGILQSVSQRAVLDCQETYELANRIVTCRVSRPWVSFVLLRTLAVNYPDCITLAIHRQLTDDAYRTAVEGGISWLIAITAYFSAFSEILGRDMDKALTWLDISIQHIELNLGDNFYSDVLAQYGAVAILQGEKVRHATIDGIISGGSVEMDIRMRSLFPELDSHDELSAAFQRGQTMTIDEQKAFLLAR